MGKKKKKDFKEQLQQIKTENSMQGRYLKILLEKLKNRKERKVDEKILENLQPKGDKFDSHCS